MKLDTESTICAIATGNVGAVRGAIRVSGPDALSICASAFQLEKDVCWSTRRAARFSRVVTLPRLGPIEVGIFVWPDSRSYTGQPSVELHCIGNLIVLQTLQTQLIECGAVLAQAGEFTLRAFLAGRLDLTQCEAVLGVIHASNERALQVALAQLAGGLAAPLQQLRTDLVHLLADIEAGLDFVDEDISFVTSAQVVERLEASKQRIQELARQMESRGGQSVELQVVLVGAPNAGKSSLVNALAQSQVSIVSEQAGTTRDYVKHRMKLGDVTLDLLDTAGLEERTSHSPRGIAQDFTRTQLQNADLVLYCQPVDNAELGLLDRLQGIETPLWLLHTKSDLPPSSALGEFPLQASLQLTVSALKEESLARLRQHLSEWASSHMESVGSVVPATAMRCQNSLQLASLAIEHAIEAAEHDRGDEIVANEIRIALDEIGMVAGTVYTDDILDALFSRFCIGK